MRITLQHVVIEPSYRRMEQVSVSVMAVTALQGVFAQDITVSKCAKTPLHGEPVLCVLPGDDCMLLPAQCRSGKGAFT